MPNGSLDAHLWGKRRPLPWAVRYKISLGLASALLYLHEEWEQCVVHRDIKSSNVMLDSSFGVKLGDFGLARLMDHELVPDNRVGRNFRIHGSRIHKHWVGQVGLESLWERRSSFGCGWKLQNDLDEKQVECLMIVGLWCAHLNRNACSHVSYTYSISQFREPSITTSLQEGR
ncbi:hypothetical protein SLA2020_412950 [Shorea laevis]